MSEQDLANLRELDRIAERAGGYVVPPDSVVKSKKFQEDFSIMRRYCVKHNKKFAELTEEDYEKMGIRPF